MAKMLYNDREINILDFKKILLGVAFGSEDPQAIHAVLDSESNPLGAHNLKQRAIVKEYVTKLIALNVSTEVLVDSFDAVLGITDANSSKLSNPRVFGKALGMFIEKMFLGYEPNSSPFSDIEFVQTEVKTSSGESKGDLQVSQITVVEEGGISITEEEKSVIAAFKMWRKMQNLLHFEVQRAGTASIDRKTFGRIGGVGEERHGKTVYQSFRKKWGDAYDIVSAKRIKDPNNTVRDIRFKSLNLHTVLQFAKIWTKLFDRSYDNTRKIVFAERSSGNRRVTTRGNEVVISDVYNIRIPYGTEENLYSLLDLYLYHEDLLTEFGDTKNRPEDFFREIHKLKMELEKQGVFDIRDIESKLDNSRGFLKKIL